MVISHYIVIQVANGYKNIIKHDAAIVYDSQHVDCEHRCIHSVCARMGFTFTF